jgi:predicted MFS family arabinose efflux permease
MLGQALAGSLSGPALVAALIAAQFAGSAGVVVYNVNQVSLRQAITPDHLLGRMNASVRFLIWGTIPIGALIGGFLGERIGLRPTLFVGAGSSFLSLLWLLLSPVRRVRRAEDVLPSPTADQGAPTTEN